jgi:hypothetical protein
MSEGQSFDGSQSCCKGLRGQQSSLRNFSGPSPTGRDSDRVVTGCCTTSPGSRSLAREDIGSTVRSWLAYSTAAFGHFRATSAVRGASALRSRTRISIVGKRTRDPPKLTAWCKPSRVRTQCLSSKWHLTQIGREELRCSSEAFVDGTLMPIAAITNTAIGMPSLDLGRLNYARWQQNLSRRRFRTSPKKAGLTVL